MTDTDQRLNLIEQRLAALERALSEPQEPAAARSAAARPPGEPEAAPAPTPAANRRAVARPKSISASTFMALGAAGSFLLAAGYFVVLAYEWGWLTPTRQLLIAFAAGLALIGGGLWFAGRDRDYAAYMPAVGLVVLYFAIYAGHLYYGMIPVTLALVVIGGISVVGIVLGWRFGNSVFTILAALGVYLTPVLIRASFADVTGIVIYFSVWSLLFSFFALQEGRRATYLVALYLALVGFDAAWRIAGSPEWAVAAGYQLVQFLIFAATAVIFTVRHRHPMDDAAAVLHGVPLFYFYGLEFMLLKQHAPGLVAPAALASVIVVMGLFLVARRRFRDPAMLAASSGLVAAYCAFVTGHILFIELLPDAYFAWGALLLPLVIGALQRQFHWNTRVMTPVTLISAVLFICGFGLTLFELDDTAKVPLPNLALVLYGVVLYGVAYVVKGNERVRQFAAIALYGGHLALMVATVRIFDSGLTISILWAGAAVALLLVAVRTRSRHLGQSSLVIFTASAIKVLLFDMAGSAPLIRIGTLVVLGGSLYVGGWLYQNLARATTPLHPDSEIDEQLRLIRDLVRQGYDDGRIVQQLVELNVPCRKTTGWDEALVSGIRADYGLN